MSGLKYYKSDLSLAEARSHPAWDEWIEIVRFTDPAEHAKFSSRLG